MSRQSSSKISAFQVFSAVTKVTPDGGKKQDPDETNKKKPNVKMAGLDIHSKPNNMPKSLMTMVKEDFNKRHAPPLPNKKNFSNVKPRKEGNPKSVKSLLDISFDNPARNDNRLNQNQMSRRDKHQVVSSRRDIHARQQRSRFETDEMVQKSQLIDSGLLSTPPASLSFSDLKPLVVEMKAGDKTGRSPPKPLLDFATIGLAKKRPMSLLDLSQPRQRTERVKVPQMYRTEQIHGVSNQRVKVNSRKRKVETEDAGSKFSVTEMNSDPGIDQSLKKKKIEPSHASARIRTCQGKRCHFLIIPATLPWLHINGIAQMCVEMGTISIMAFTLRSKVIYDVYSPPAGCLLAMHVDNTIKIAASDVKDEISRFCGSDVDKELKDLADDTVAVVRVRQLKSRVYDYLTSFIPFSQLFKVAVPKEHERSDLSGVTLPSVGIKVAPPSEMTHMCMNWSPEYNNVLDKWSLNVSSRDGDAQSPILLTCGGRNSGKSILNRCAVNVALQSVERVAYLDVDVGQSEFSPPATMSLHIITSPVLGPPFCHQQHAERMVFYGDINPSQDPGFYVRCLQDVFEAYSAMASKSFLPLVVNTMGFPEGVGLMLFIDTMNVVKPDLVVQLETAMQYNNFPAVTQEMVALDEGWTFNKIPADDPGRRVSETKAHQLFLLSSLASPKRDFSLKLQPMDLRNLALLSSLSSGLEKDVTLMTLTPYVVPYKCLAIHVCHHRLAPTQLLAALNASVVALCQADLSTTTKEREDLPRQFSEMPICNCVGLGFVRAVDEVKGELLISTTLPRSRLSQVNTILKGNLALPDHFFLNQKSSKPLPYVDALAPSTAVAAVRPRTRMPRVSLGKD